MCQDHINKQILKGRLKKKFNKKTKKYNKLIRILSNVNFLQKCYFSVKLNFTNLKWYVSKKILSGINNKWFRDISRKLKKGKYAFNLNFMRNILKLKVNKIEYITFSFLSDMLVYEGFNQLLFVLYELKLSKYSDVIKKKKNIHQVLYSIKNWKNVFWVLCFKMDKQLTFQHKKFLILVLKEDIEDPKFFNVIYKLLNDNTFKVAFTEQILYKDSPFSLFLNLYLNRLDKYIENLMIQYNKYKKGDQEWKCKNNRVLSLKKVELSEITPQNECFFNLARINYTRYSNDFILGIFGSKIFVSKIMVKIVRFVHFELFLKILNNKNRIVSIIQRKAFFLGFFIKKSFKHLNSNILKRFNNKSKKKNCLKKVGYEVNIAETLELKKTKQILKKFIIRSLSNKSWNQKNIINIINNMSQIVQNEKLKNFPLETKPFFSNSILKTVMSTNKLDISNKIFNIFEKFRKAVRVDLKIKSKQINDAKILSKMRQQVNSQNLLARKQLNYTIQLYAPIDLIKHKLKKKKILSKNGQPQILNWLIQKSDINIFYWYAFLARKILNYYKCVDNLYSIKSLINYQIRWSMYRTLAKKRKMSLRKIIQKYGDEFLLEKCLQHIFPSKIQIARIKKSFLVENLVKQPFDFFNRRHIIKSKCLVKKCKCIEIEIFDINQLNIKTRNINILTSSRKKNKKRKACLIFKRKASLSLCHKHHIMFHQNRLLFKS